MSPGLGVGVVWWPELDPLCGPGEGLVDVIEAEPEAFWSRCDKRYHSALGDALAHRPQPKLLHGVGAPLGGSCQPPDGHLEAFAHDVATLRPRWVSEHLSFSRFRPDDAAPPVVAGFLLPPAQTDAGAAMAARNIRERRAALGVAIAFETAVSYLPPLPGELPDGDFAAAVAEAADCHILLDLHNIWCNQRNGRQSVAAFCAALPLHRVRELHLAGGEEQAGFWLDGHSGQVPPALLDIAADLVPRLANLEAIVFEIMPDRVKQVGLAAIARDLMRLREIWASRGSAAAARDTTRTRRTAGVIVDDWERLIGGALVLPDAFAPQPALAEWWGNAAPAIALYRWLWAEGRGSALAATAPHTLRQLLATSGLAGTRGVLAAFNRAVPPGYTAIDEAHAFLPFAAATLPGLDAAIAADLAALE
jgi:uncharacterized protein (UPF0276 family)